jgi:hypothetical protein
MTTDWGPKATFMFPFDAFTALDERCDDGAFHVRAVAACWGSDAFATPTPVTSAPKAMAIERLARFTTFFFVVRYIEFPSIGQSFAAET